MTSGKNIPDPYIDLTPVPNYYLKEKKGEGKIGVVYKAIRSDPKDILACKIIPEGNLKQGWERELEKVSSLRGINNVVQYHGHGSSFDKNKRPFTWIMWDYIEGINLREYLEYLPWPLDISFIENTAGTLLNVLYACQAQNIIHGDLHEGNILISEPDQRLRDKSRKIVVSDFGYGGSHNKVEPKNDVRQFYAIITSMLNKIDFFSLDPRDKNYYQKLDNFLRKKILENDPTQGRPVGVTDNLIDDFENIAREAERESAAATKGDLVKGPGDYLWAEALGNKAEEWKTLFVPEFLAAQDLLSKNVTVLTGARGCGKTMVFRRLTAFMDKLVGESSGVVGSDQFVGFYLNCRDFVEAFPWLPRVLSPAMQQQITHYFHLCWISEICKSFALDKNTSNTVSFEWLGDFFNHIFGKRYQTPPLGSNILAHARAFIEDEKERCRLTDLGEIKGLINWPLARVDFLDIFQKRIESHVSWIGQLPLYFFLDDYTIPIITSEVQRQLNSIVFKRRDKIFFKISTESSNSFERDSLRRKPLELSQDFELIDLATESIHQDNKDKKRLLEKIFKARIERDNALKGKSLGLVNLLGITKHSGNRLAQIMRTSAKDKQKKSITYQGLNAFVGIWDSDVRIMIQIFTNMLRESRINFNGNNYTIPDAIQDKEYRTQGGEFLTFTNSLINPLEYNYKASRASTQSYGMHLRDIVEAFVNVSRYELTEGELVSNKDSGKVRLNPRQAFRLEIIDKFNLPGDVIGYYEGLVRWHIFLQDWRGKSIRGMITPRLFLHRVLIPFCGLTFSSHDNIHLTNDEFISLLREPKEFIIYWKKKRKEEKDKKEQKKIERLAQGKQQSFWDKNS